MQINTWPYRTALDWKALLFFPGSPIFCTEGKLWTGQQITLVLEYYYGADNCSIQPSLSWRVGREGRSHFICMASTPWTCGAENNTPDLTRDDFFQPKDVKQPSHCPNWAAGVSDFIFRKMENIYGIEENSKYLLNDQMIAHSNSLSLPDRFFFCLFHLMFLYILYYWGYLPAIWTFFLLSSSPAPADYISPYSTTSQSDALELTVVSQ